MTFNAASRLLEDRSAALGSRRCELPGMPSVPKSAVLPYASGVGGLSRRLLNVYVCPTGGQGTSDDPKGPSTKRRNTKSFDPTAILKWLGFSHRSHSICSTLAAQM